MSAERAKAPSSGGQAPDDRTQVLRRTAAAEGTAGVEGRRGGSVRTGSAQSGGDETARGQGFRGQAAWGEAARRAVRSVSASVERGAEQARSSGSGAAARGARTGGSGGASGRGRRARLRLRRVDPWSVFLVALVVSLFLAIALVVAVVALYAVLAAAGVPESLNQLFAEVTRRPGQPDPQPLLTASRAITTAGVVALVDVVLLTSLATLGALLYNVCASFTGGVEVTLAEPDDR